MNCHQFVVNQSGEVFQPTCTGEKCGIWLKKRKMCAYKDTALALNSILSMLSMQLNGRPRNVEGDE